MSGFLFSLKGKAAKSNDTNNTSKISFGLGGKNKQTKPDHNKKKTNFLSQSDSESDEEKITSIETFSGSTKSQEHKHRQQETIIRPQNLNKSLVKKPIPGMTGMGGMMTAKQSSPQEEVSDSKSTANDSGRVINISNDQANSDAEEADMDSYKEVPVEEFGAALLKGMGWNQKKEGSINKPHKSNVDKRKQGLLLGIGAKAVQDNDLAQELLSSKAKFSIPVKRKHPTTNKSGDEP